MAEMSPGDRCFGIKLPTYKWGRLKIAKLLFFVISTIVCVVIFYANTNIIGGQSLFTLFSINNRNQVTFFFHPHDELKSYKLKHLHFLKHQTELKKSSNPFILNDHYKIGSYNYTSAFRTNIDITFNDTRSLVINTLLMKPLVIQNGSRTLIQTYNVSQPSQVSPYNIFVIYTKENYQLHIKFELFVRSLLKYSISDILLHLHILTDENSAHSVEQMLANVVRRYRRSVVYSLYNMRLCAERVVGVVNAMAPYFSSTPKSYYSDSLFFISLGLHNIADKALDRAVMLDCDIVFRADIRLLFAEFEYFTKDNLFGLAPELTPVYRHILYRYRATNPKTNFGSPFYLTQNELHRVNKYQYHGYPGLNSGVILLQLNRIRHSQFYQQQLQENEVRLLSTKYMFKGHLGDQDFFTLIGYEYPELIYRLDCVWNRQLCTWWKDHGYSDVFDHYFTCKGHIKMYHGNCNARVPE